MSRDAQMSCASAQAAEGWWLYLMSELATAVSRRVSAGSCKMFVPLDRRLSFDSPACRSVREGGSPLGLGGCRPAGWRSGLREPSAVELADVRMK